MVQLSSPYGKDLSDSLGGAVYNATLQVDVNELDYMDSVILTDGGLTTLNTSNNMADRIFGITRNMDGTVTVNPEIKVTEKTDINEEINKQIQQQVQNSQNIVQQIKKDNPNTNLSNQQIKELYDNFSDDGFILF